MTTQVLTARFGRMHDPADAREFENLQGFDGLRVAVSKGAEYVLGELDVADLRGRGGAGYPAAKKWRSLYRMNSDQKYIVCNADEGEPGTFKDKALIDFDPLNLIEGMTIAGYVFGSHQGYIYLRGEYRQVHTRLEQALASARERNFLGKHILGIEGFDYDIRIISGAGAYVCGESSALLNSIEGKTGRPRVKPPHLAEVGLYQKPTLVNNVETYACVPYIVANGGAQFGALGLDGAKGTKLVCLSGHVKNRGIFEVPLGTPVLDLINAPEYGGGSATGNPLKFVHFGGQSGAIGAVHDFEGIRYSYEDMRAHGLTIGSGALVIMDSSVDLLDYLIQVARFFAHESCGKCTPCRLGTQRLLELLEKFKRDEQMPGDAERLDAMMTHITQLSACGLGQAAAVAARSAIAAFPDELAQLRQTPDTELVEVAW